MQQLVTCKMQLAELNESYLSTCHELHKAKEKNLAIAAKMTRYAATGRSCHHTSRVILLLQSL